MTFGFLLVVDIMRVWTLKGLTVSSVYGAEHERQLVNQSIQHQQQLYGLVRHHSTDGLLNKLTQGTLPAQVSFVLLCY